MDVPVHAVAVALGAAAEDMVVVGYSGGMVVFLLIKEVMMPPAVSIPRDRGATSRSSRSETASEVSPSGWQPGQQHRMRQLHQG